jgi:CHASE1-domain containing sensor protein
MEVYSYSAHRFAALGRVHALAMKRRLDRAGRHKFDVARLAEGGWPVRLKERRDARYPRSERPP